MWNQVTKQPLRGFEETEHLGGSPWEYLSSQGTSLKPSGRGGPGEITSYAWDGAGSVPGLASLVRGDSETWFECGGSLINFHVVTLQPPRLFSPVVQKITARP